MRDSRIGSYGALALILSSALRGTAVAALAAVPGGAITITYKDDVATLDGRPVARRPGQAPRRTGPARRGRRSTETTSSPRLRTGW